LEPLDRFGGKIGNIVDPGDRLAVYEEDDLVVAQFAADLVDELAHGWSAVFADLALAILALGGDAPQRVHHRTVADDENFVTGRRLGGIALRQGEARADDQENGDTARRTEQPKAHDEPR